MMWWSSDTGVSARRRRRRRAPREILNLPAGTYKVTVTSANFETVNFPGIHVQEMQAKTLNSGMQPGKISEPVSALTGISTSANTKAVMGGQIRAVITH
jgi:hypothetical protein